MLFIRSESPIPVRGVRNRIRQTGEGVEGESMEIAATTKCFAEKQDFRKTGCLETRMFFLQVQIKCCKKAKRPRTNQRAAQIDKERALADMRRKSGML